MHKIILPCIFLIVGFVALIKGADFFVDGAGSIAKKFRIPDIIVGLTVVAMGTSAPELATSISAAIAGSNEIAVGNVIGSNLMNILVILGLSAIIKPLIVDTSIFKRDIPVMLICTAILPISTLLGRYMPGEYKLTRIVGVILLAFFAFYLFITVSSALKYKKERADDAPDESIKAFPWWKSILFTVGGAAMIIIGADIAVDSARSIAIECGISENIIALTVVAFGTSLPELITSVIAAKKGSSDIALGNIVGSNIFNILLILGTTLVISPITVNLLTLIDGFILLGVTAYLAFTAFTGKKLSRIEGASYLVLYAGYMVYLFLR